MKLVKYCGFGVYKLKFDLEYLLKTYKGIFECETGLVAKYEDTVYHFDEDCKTYSICSKVTSPTWSKKKCADHINKVLPNTRCYLKTSYVVFEDNVNICEGGLELLHFNINKFQFPGIITNAFEPELFDYHIIRFSQMNNVELNVNIFEDGRLIITCFPVENSVSIIDMEFESKEVKNIIEYYLRFGRSIIHT